MSFERPLKTASTSVAALALLFSCTGAAHEASGAPKMDFVPPAAGSYRLDRIMSAPEGRVLGVDEKSTRLSRFTRGKVTLLSFIFATCTDPRGCSLAYHVFAQLKEQIENTPELHDKVRLVSLSFDPEMDTPETMKLYAGSYVKQGKGVEWYFLTTRSQQDLEPLLKGFGQYVERERDHSHHGRDNLANRQFSHVLKVFLIDRKAMVREIYSTSFLMPEVMMNDIKTLMMEDGLE